jgi:archaellum component FlaC
MAENKKNPIILLHGNEQFTQEKATNLGLVKGELVVEHGADDVKLHTLDGNNKLGSFLSEKAVNALISATNETVEGLQDEVSALEEVVGDAEGGLVKDVANSKEAIAEIQEALGLNPGTEGGETLTSRIEVLEEVVGDETAGLVKTVADNTLAIEQEKTDREEAIKDVNDEITDLKAVVAGFTSKSGETVADEFAKVRVEISDVQSGLTETIEGHVSTLEGAIEAVGEDVSSLEDHADAVDTILSGFSADATVDAAVKAAKTEVKLKEGETVLILTPSTDADGHAVYTLETTNVAAADTLEGVQDAVNKLIGKVDGDETLSAREIARDELARQLLNGGEEGQTAGESFETLKELAAWLEQHPDDVATMNAAIAELQKVVAGYSSTGTTIANAFEAVDQAIEDLQDNKATKTELQDVVDAQALVNSGFTKSIADEIKAREEAISGVTESISTESGERAKLDERVQTIESKYINNVLVSGVEGVEYTVEDGVVTIDLSSLKIDGGTY